MAMIDPRLPPRHRESLPPMPPSCMWGPIGPPSKPPPGLAHGDVAADVGSGTSRWSLSQMSPTMTPHLPYLQHAPPLPPPPGFAGVSGVQDRGGFLRGRGDSLAAPDPRSGDEYKK